MTVCVERALRGVIIWKGEKEGKGNEEEGKAEGEG